MQESTQTTEKEFIKACQDLQWTHDPKTPHRSETTGIAGRSAFRVRESTGGTAMECYSRKNVHDNMADDKEKDWV